MGVDIPVSTEVKQILVGAAALALLACAGIGAYWYHENAVEEANLRNELAGKDKTTEELADTYTKLDMENKSLKSSNAQLQSLLDKTKQDLISESQLSLYWKGQYEYVLSHAVSPATTADPFKPAPVTSACTTAPQTYRATQDLGVVSVTVDTYTLDPGYQQHLLVGPGGTPLKLTLDITRDQALQWHTHVVSSDPRVGVNIDVASVNVQQLEEKWYEKLRLKADLGVGGKGALVGLGASYGVGKWDLGPSLWGVSGAGTFWGATIGWTPWKQVNQ
jgi:cell division protein FtsB